MTMGASAADAAGSADERAALSRLLDAVDKGAPALAELLAERPHQGAFFGPLTERSLCDAEVALLLVALAARLEGRPALSGAELSLRAARDSAGRLAALAHLLADAPLVSAGLLVPEVLPADGTLAQSTIFRLGEHIFRLACRVFDRRPPAPAAPLPTAPYRNNTEVLADLRRLSLLYRRRAARIFHLDPWTSTGIEVLDAAHELVARAREESRRVSGRIASTPVSDALPILELRAQHNLDLDALVILVTLLFQELVEGVGAVDAVDLLKLVSTSEDELLRRRMLLRPLQRQRLIQLEGAYAGKELTADASLPNRIVDQLLGSPETIGVDERIDFHAYLQKLDSSDPFFDSMEGEPG
jgi:hypothetical protein